MRLRRTSVAVLTTAIALAVSLGVSGAASAAGTAMSAARWQFHQLDADRCWDATTLDANFNGNVEQVWYDVDNDCRWDTHLWNSVAWDGFLESMTFDMDENGRWEYWLADNDQRVGFDVAYFDDNADGYYDRWAYVPNAPTTRLPTLAEQIGEGTVVGGTPQRSGAMGLVVYLSRFTGQAAWAPPDRDGDGTPDPLDRYPGRPG
jgi:hypothetical protein